VDVAEQSEVDRFLPSLTPRFRLDTDDPYVLYPLVTPAAYMEMRYNMQMAMEAVPDRYDRVEKEFASIFGRSYGPVEAVCCEDAEIILVTSGTVVSTGRLALQALRSAGERVGLLKIKMFRPFPVDLVRQHLAAAQKVAVIDRNFSFGASGIFAQELKAAMCGVQNRAAVFGYVAGLGGRDITPDTLKDIYRRTKTSPAPTSESIWIGLNQEIVDSWNN